MGKKIGYWLFAVFFTVFRIVPINEKKVFFVATHDDSEEGNIGIVANAIREKMPDYRLVFLTTKDGISHPFSFFVKKAFHLATSKTIFMDNMFMPMAYTPISKKAKVVMLWHGTGTIKKFGLDSDTGEVYRLAKKADKRLTHLIVNSELTKKQYMTAFNMRSEDTYILGLPRTDLILDEKKAEEKEISFYKEYPDLKEKNIILYAPTFRDSEADNPRLMLDLERFARTSKENDVLLLRLHPFVAANFDDTEMKKYEGKIYNMSKYSKVTTLLEVADTLITDYSSIIFEYVLRNKPIIFYAYDLDEFEKHGRDFYEDYKTFVPGKIVCSEDELFDALEVADEFKEKRETFIEQSFAFKDRSATTRLLSLIFGMK